MTFFLLKLSQYSEVEMGSSCSLKSDHNDWWNAAAKNQAPTLPPTSGYGLLSMYVRPPFASASVLFPFSSLFSKFFSLSR